MRNSVDPYCEFVTSWSDRFHELFFQYNMHSDHVFFSFTTYTSWTGQLMREFLHFINQVVSGQGIQNLQWVYTERPRESPIRKFLFIG